MLQREHDLITYQALIMSAVIGVENKHDSTTMNVYDFMTGEEVMVNNG